MRSFAFLALLVSLEVGMAACAVPAASLRAELRSSDALAQVEQDSDPPGLEEGLTFLCSESHSTCALFRRENASGHAGALGQIVLARGVGPALEPFPETASANRYWGSAQGLPEDSSPVFIIPWHHQDSRPLLPPGLEEAIQKHISGPGRLVKHHIFPQAFKEWFTIKGINIHAETMLLELHVHERIHRGANGGPWNDAWWEFIEQNGGATKEDIWRYAGELIHRFDIEGPLLPYYGRVALPCSFLWSK